MTRDAELRVLTVRQPWASAIAAGAKTVENRTRGTRYRGLVAIHAGLQGDPTALSARPPYRTERPQHLIDWLRSRPDEERRAEMPRGAVLAVARIAGAHRSLDCPGCGPWGEHGPEVWHWRLSGVVRLAEPIPYRGALGLPHARPELWDAIP
jgi:hypothetical protein